MGVLEAFGNIPNDQIWMVVVGFIVAFIFAFGIGANDVANSFGTAVGAKVLTLKQAFILATVFETLGAVLLGSKVSDTIRNGIIDVMPYKNETNLLMIGNIAALAGSCIWSLAATMLRLPISATHSIVGSTIGFALVARGVNDIKWSRLAIIAGSWVLSPILAGIVSVLFFWFCQHFILSKKEPLEPGLRFLPILYALTIAVNVFSVFYLGSEVLYFYFLPLWATFVITLSCGIMTAILVFLLVVPWQRKKIKAELEKIAQDPLNTTSVPVTIAEPAPEPTSEYQAINSVEKKKEPSQKGRAAIQDAPETASLFSFLQILTVVFMSFAHGGNDVSNAIAPLVSLWLIGTTGQVTGYPTPILILLYGGIGMSLGLIVLGSKVIKTVGEDLTKVTPSSGFCIEIGTAISVLVASNFGMPISTTHCKVGSVVFVGRFRARENVDWSIFRNILFAWLVTLPICGGISAAIMACLKQVL